MELTKLYSVSHIRLDENNKVESSGTVATCLTLERAKQIVETNEGDIYEYYYDLIVIEKYFADILYGWDGNEFEFHWYRWNKESQKYEPCEHPEQFQNQVAFWG
jgi:hypothetical protein